MIKEFVFTGETAPTAQCHASTVAALPGGVVAAAWFGGTREGADDVRIWFSVRENGVWSKAVPLDEGEQVSHWNPVLFADADRLMLFYKKNKPISQWYTMFRESRDGGKRWSAPKELVGGDLGGRGPVKNKPIRQNNLILAPASLELGTWRAFVDISEDGGQTWTPSNMIYISEDQRQFQNTWNSDSEDKTFKSKGIIQPTLWASSEKDVHMLLRSSEGAIYRSDSKDEGRTWCMAYPTEMPNNNSGLDLAVLPDGRLVLICNPVGKNWGPRTPVSLFVSGDNGKSFAKFADLETDEGEYSYPSIICADNTVYIVYTYKREKIAFCKINADEL